MSEGTSAIITGGPVTATGGVLAAPLGSAGPADARTALTEAFKKLGYVSEDGLTKTVDASDEKVRAWGGDVVKVVRQEHSVSYSFTFLESANAEVLKAIKGDENVTIEAATETHGNQVTVLETSEMPPRQEYVFDMKDGDALVREYVPDGQISVSGDVTFVHSAVIAYTVTIEAFPDEGGVKAYSFQDDGQLTSAA